MPPGVGELTDEILQGGTLGLIAVLLAVVLGLGYAAIRVIRAFLKREIITAATFEETKERDRAEIRRVEGERDRAIEALEAQSEATTALAGTLQAGLGSIATGLAELRAATETRNELEALYHSGEPPPRRRTQRSKPG